MMLGLRSFNLTKRQKTAEAVIKKNLPPNFTVKAEPIAEEVLHHFPILAERIIFYERFGKPWGSSEHSERVAFDLNVRSKTGKTVLQVRIWKIGRPLIRYDADAELALARTLAQTLKREGLYIRRIEVVQGIDDPTARVSVEPLTS